MRAADNLVQYSGKEAIMAHHDLIDQLAAAIKDDKSILSIIRRAFDSGLDIMTVEALLQTANELAAE